MKTIIAGSRTIQDYSLVCRAVQDSGFHITEVFCGLTPGVDMLGCRWARERKIPVRFFKANWDKEGKSAGLINIFEMCAYADQAIGLWDTKDFLQQWFLKFTKGCEIKTYNHVLLPEPSLISQGRAESTIAAPMPLGA
jgi:hypothetical protein